eukprot:scaffold14831_cov214-Alexandrium_tamarense.AAC.3
MKLSILLASIATATAATQIDTSDIPATSKMGARILSKARQLGDNKDNDITWVANYSLKFEKCATSTDYYGGYFGGNQAQGNNNRNNNRQGYNGMYQQRLIHFKLCPSSSCSSCSGGADYVIDMNEFMGAYLESKMNAQEYNCEKVRENCYCDDANDDDACEATCFAAAGLDYCQQEGDNNGENKNQFNLQEAVECRRMEVDEDAMNYYAYQNGGNGQNNAYYGGQMEFFVGPYCANSGKQIFLGVFMDETCSMEAPKGIYAKLNYGQSLPYSSTSLIESGCVSCKEPEEYDENNNGDQQDEDKVLEICENLYEQAGKCETDLTALNAAYGQYPNTYACDFIKGLKASGKSRINFSQMTNSVKNATPATLAGVFAATTVLFGGLAMYLHQKIQRSNVNLVSDGGAMA